MDLQKNNDNISNQYDMSSLISEIDDDHTFNSNRATLGKNKKNKKENQKSELKPNYDFKKNQLLTNIQTPLINKIPVKL